jgi:predicted ATPase
MKQLFFLSVVLGVYLHTNLPSDPAILGREDEIHAICHLLAQETLVTLTGPGGIGKTTLAVAVAHAWSHATSHPFSFCALASLREAEQVPLAIAQALGVATDAQTAEIALVEYFRSQAHPVLLVLDNFEHLMTASACISRLLEEACSQIKILVTSREILQLRREVVFEVLPLALPSEETWNVPSVALFQRHAQRVLPSFHVADHLSTVVEICRQLEGIPLALELAAARLQLFSPEELLQRLDRRLSVLSSSRRDLPLRQRTLRKTMEWSYHLLTVQEQKLFRWFSVFEDGGTVHAVESVCTTLGCAEDVLDLITSLLNKCLLRRIEQDGNVRLVMLETIQEYALELFEESQEEANGVREAHAHYVALFVKNIQREAQTLWLLLLDQELNNIRAALQWMFSTAATPALLMMADHLARYWEMRGLNQEGFEYLSRALSLAENGSPPPTSLFALGYIYASKFALILSRPDQAFSLGQEALKLLRHDRSTPEDSEKIALCLLQIGQVAAQHHGFLLAEEYLMQGIAHFRRSASYIAIVVSLHKRCVCWLMCSLIVEMMSMLVSITSCKRAYTSMNNSMTSPGWAEHDIIFPSCIFISFVWMRPSLLGNNASPM